MTTFVAFAGSELKAFTVAAKNPCSERQAGIGLAFTNFDTHTRASHTAGLIFRAGLILRAPVPQQQMKQRVQGTANCSAYRSEDVAFTL